MEDKSFVQRAKEFLHARRFAYVQTFNPESVFVQKVMRDLAKFCRKDQTTFHPDPRIHAALEGRREVLLRIEQHLNLTPDQLWTVYGKGQE